MNPLYNRFQLHGIVGLSYIVLIGAVAVLPHGKRRNSPFSWLYVVCGLSVLVCGGVHLIEVMAAREPYHWSAVYIKSSRAPALWMAAASLAGLIATTVCLLAASRIAERQKAQLEASNTHLSELERISVELAQRAGTGVAYWELDYKTGTRRRWGDVVGVFGRQESELAGPEQFLAVVHPDDRNKVKDALDTAVRSHTEYAAEFRITALDGAIHWLLGRGRPYYDDGGTPVSMVGITIDVTGRKLWEAALQQSEKLAVTGRLAATIAHEINNPLAAAENLLYLIAHEPAATSTIQSLASQAQEELKNVDQIVKNTLGFHRECGLPARVNLPELLDSALTLYKPQIRKKKIRLDKRYDTDLAVFTHPGELRQVFVNLIGNALDALPEFGCLRVRTKPEASTVRIHIVDNGSGIPSDRRGHLFQPFFTTKGDKGTGLGLWVSRALVEKNGGRIAVRSLRGANAHATVFSIILPLALPDKEPA
jgi:PAS domain S-box-containing protein